MDVYPQDLGKKNCERVLCHRAAFAPGVAEWASPRYRSSESPLRVEMFGVLFLLATCLFLTFHAPFWELFVLLLFAGALSALGITGVRRLRRKAVRRGSQNVQDGHVGLTLMDLHHLREANGDPLQGKFFDLVQTALDLPPPSETFVAQTVRDAIGALGTTLEGLPRHSSLLQTDNPGILHAEADRLASLAQTEADAVIAASLERRADSYAHRAETVMRAQTLLRRSDALRDEMADQMDALRTSLIAAGITREIEDAGLADLATNVQRIATEVNALSAARAEVEDALHAGPDRAGDQATRIRLRKYLDEIHTVVDKNVMHPGS